MLIGVWSKADFFDNYLYRLSLYFLLFLLLLVLKLRIIDNLTNRRICIGGNFHQIQSLLLGEFYSLLNGIDINFDVFSYYPYFRSRYPFVYLVRFFWFLGAPPEWFVKTGSVIKDCDTIVV